MLIVIKLRNLKDIKMSEIWSDYKVEREFGCATCYTTEITPDPGCAMTVIIKICL